MRKASCLQLYCVDFDIDMSWIFKKHKFKVQKVKEVQPLSSWPNGYLSTKNRHGPYGGSAETSPVAAVTPCTVTPVEKTPSMRETAIVDTEVSFNGTGVVELNSPEQDAGIKISESCGIEEKEFIIKSLAPNGYADLSDELCSGDRILQINSKSLEQLSKADVDELLTGTLLNLDIKYHIPLMPQNPKAAIKTKLVDVLISKDKNLEGIGLGLTVRGGNHAESSKRRPLVISKIRENSPVDIEGTLRLGDRLVSINGIDLSNATILDVNKILKDSSGDIVIRLEYDVAVMESVHRGAGPLLVELGKAPYHKLGLTIITHNLGPRGQVAVIDNIRPGTIADRCGAFHLGAQVISIGGTKIESMSSSDIMQLLITSSEDLKMEIVPTRPPRRRDRIPISHSTANSLCGSSRHCCSGRSVHSSRSAAASLGRRPYASSIVSLASLSSSHSMPFLVSRAETTTVLIENSTNAVGFGINIQSLDTYPNENLRAPPIVDYIEADGLADRTGLIQVGDRILAINGRKLEAITLAEANQLIKESGPRLYLTTEFDVAESVVPSSGKFLVKLVKSGNKVGLKLFMPTTKQTNEYLLISDVVKSSVAHRTGTICAGDRLLAIDGIPLAKKSVDEAYGIMKASNDSIVKLLLQKDEEFADDGPNAHNLYTIELHPNGGRLGITLSGSDYPFDPIIIAAIEPGSVADRIGAIHVGDQLIAINNNSIRVQGVSEAVRLLQQTNRSVLLRICRNYDNGGMHYLDHESAYSTMRSDQENDIWAPRSLQNTPRRNDLGRPNPYEELTPRMKCGPLHEQFTSTPKPYHFNASNHSVLHSYATPQKMHKHMNGTKENLESAMKNLNMNNVVQPRPASGFYPPGHPASIMRSPSSSPSQSVIADDCKYLRLRLVKDPESRDFGFSLSQGEDCPGIYINRIRPDGPADNAGIRPLDRIIQINDTIITDDMDVDVAVPMVANSKYHVDLILQRQVTPGSKISSTSDSLNDQVKTTVIC